MDRLHDALLSKLLAGVSTPQPACPTGTAADGGLTDDATVPVAVPAAFSATTQSQEAPTVAHDAPPICIEVAPVTCSMECSTQTNAITSVDEVQDAVTTVYPERTVNLSHKEVVQLIPVHATPSIGISTSSSTKVVSFMATTTDIDPKAGAQELGALSVITTQVTSEADHDVVLIVPGNIAAPTLTRCSTKCPRHDTNLLRYSLHPVVNAFPTHAVLLYNNTKDNRAYVSLEEELLFDELQWQPWPPPVQVQIKSKGSMSRPCPWPSFDCFHEGAQLKYTWSKIIYAMNHFSGALNSLTKSLRCRQGVHLKLLCSSISSSCQAVQLCSELPTVEFQFNAHGSTYPNFMGESWWCLQKITYKISHMEHLFRPRPWRSLKYDSVAGYLEEPSSGTHHQPHEVSRFSVELVPLPFSDVSSPQVPYRQSNSMEESFCCLPGAKLQSGCPPDRATAGNIIQMPPVRVRISHMGHLFKPRPWPSFKYHSNAGYPDEPYSGIHNQPHDVSWFIVGLVLFLFRDEDFIPVCCCELIPMEEPFICLLQCETSYGFYWEMLALAVETFREHFLLQPKPPWNLLDWPLSSEIELIAGAMAAVLHANNVEEDKLAEDTSLEVVRVVQSTGKNHAKEQTEDGSAKRMDRAFSTMIFTPSTLMTRANQRRWMKCNR